MIDSGSRIRFFEVFFLVDRNIVIAVGGEQVEAGGIGEVKFHCV
jgi:hypothetical protein